MSTELAKSGHASIDLISGDNFERVVSAHGPGCGIMRPPLSISAGDEALFWASVDKRADDECWPWIGATHDKRHYGKLWLRDAKRVVIASRVSAQLAHGDPTAPCVLHSCDNPVCVNPAHLRYGTQAENIRDRDERDRGPVGERHGRAQLTEAKVVAMRSAHAAGATTRELGERFGVTMQTARYAVTRRTWRHVA